MLSCLKKNFKVGIPINFVKMDKVTRPPYGPSFYNCSIQQEINLQF